MSDLIKIVNRENPVATITVSLENWPLTSAQSIGTIRAGNGWDVHVPLHLNPYDVAKQLVFDVKPKDDPALLNMRIIQEDRVWCPIFVEGNDRFDVVFRESTDEEYDNCDWENDFDPSSHYLCVENVASFFYFTGGAGPFSSSYAGALLELDLGWLDVEQRDYLFKHVIEPTRGEVSTVITSWAQRHNLSALLLVMHTECMWANEDAKARFEDARIKVGRGLAALTLNTSPEVIRECIEKLTDENLTNRKILDAIESGQSPISSLIVEALETASEEESAHPIFELEWTIANA